MSTTPQQMLTPTTAVSVPPFPITSRYYGIATSTMKDQDGDTIVYLQRRFVPPPDRFALLQEHTVTQGERLDNIAAHYLGDPEAFWRVCDPNNAMRPDELTETLGRRLRITLPEGIPTQPNA
jgi:hypothetical protein